MRRILIAILVGSMGLMTLTAQEPNPAEPEVLTRGPIHEAYATSPSVSPQPGPLAGKAPPELIDELPPEERPEGEVVWIPGYWHWDEERTDFIWISGFWRTPPPGRQWIPGTWRQAGDTFQWNSGFWAGAQSQQIEYVPPPPAPLEAAASTPAPGEDYLFAPGCWVYRETRYQWRPGFWYAYRPNWVYIPAHYVWSPAGYVFVDGYWDYPLQRRGVLFAPVYFTAGVYARPHYRYRPSYVLYEQALYGSLFVRPGFSAYYFGDYFDVRYTNYGYRSWFDVRVGVGGYDPLWGYYRHHYAATPGWSVGITTLYAGRYNGSVARPPRTFVQQNTVINNINKTTVVNNTTINNIQNVTMAAPINKVDKTVVNLKPVSAAEQQAAVNNARDFRTAQTERVKLESQAMAQVQNNQAGKSKGPAQPVRVNMPSSPVKNTVAPPAPPSPKDQPRAADAPQPKAGTPAPKDQPKATVPQPKEQPNAAPKDQPKVTTPPGSPKATTPPPLPKDAPKTPAPQPKEEPKSTTPPPLPKETPKTPAPAPKEIPKTPAPLPKEQPKLPPPPAPKETPKAPPPQPKSVNPPPTPPPQPKAPVVPAPQPKSPPPPPPAPKTPPPPPKAPPKNDPPKGKGNNPPPQASSVVPNTPAPRPIAPPAPRPSPPPAPPQPAPKAINPPPAPKQGPPQKPAERPKGGNEKKGDKPKQ